jgi:hypothetical protein
MENIENRGIENNTEKIDFEALRQQVESIQKVEMAKKENGEDYDTHFDIIDSSKLTEEDLLIFDKFLKKVLTKKDMANYKIIERNDSPSANFEWYLINKLQCAKWFNFEGSDETK